ncbi:MAG TPA: ATP-binding cassette domain-containing protein [Chthonomonadales bacterium]|nr:ATP-binding cassette domain-containing protein [Chthonomonadales bacterium]
MSTDLLETAVHKVSLGQRMRCEVAASLLHRPKLILLDEPSIGRDVVARQRIRHAIRETARLENVGVLLTSHDAGDLEALCKRVIIKLGHYGVKLRFDTRTTPVEKVLSDLTHAGSVVNITISDPPLEEVIAQIYQTEQAAG